MSRLWRTRTGDLRHLNPAWDVPSDYQIEPPQLIPPGTSSLGTARFRTLQRPTTTDCRGARPGDVTTSAQPVTLGAVPGWVSRNTKEW